MSPIRAAVPGSSTALRTNTFDTTGETVSKFTDALGRVTNFIYTATTGTGAGQLITIQSPGGVSMHFGYDSAGRVKFVNQYDGTAGNNVTQLVYLTVDGAATSGSRKRHRDYYGQDPKTDGNLGVAGFHPRSRVSGYPIASDPH